MASVHLPATAWRPAALAAAVVALAFLAALTTLALATPLPAVLALLALAGVVPAAAWWSWREQEDARGALASAHAALRRQTVRDELTGCLDERGLELLGEQVLAAVRRSGDAMYAAVVEVADLDGLRHHVGRETVDDVLVAVADGLRAGTRSTDVVARWGADEFVVVGPGSGCGSAELERRVRVHLSDAPPVPRAPWGFRVTVGAGTLQPWDSGGLAQLVDLARSDLSLRRALRGPSAPEPVHRPQRD